MSRLQFRLQATASTSNARAATFQTLHGKIETPLFMPVGTQATVRGLRTDDLSHLGSSILLANTYHLLLRPGMDVFRKVGGIHKFMNWPGSILTDSGGFQIFSLPHACAISEVGAEFRSYVDGQMHQLSPETSIEMQVAIGSDIMMVLDQCITSTADFAAAEKAMHLTHRWAKRSLQARGESKQAMFGIAQGACFKELRRQSIEVLSEMPFDGYAIGGLAVGETKEIRDEFTEFSASLLPKQLPRYLMGVGMPIDLLESVHRGVDMFDCIIPTALSQQGVTFTSVGKVKLQRTVYKFSDDPLDPNCTCSTCSQYSRAYLHHLIKTREPLGATLCAHHNLQFYHQLMRQIRISILENRFESFYQKQRENLVQIDES